MSKYRIGIIGAGSVSDAHIKAYILSGRAELEAIADIDEKEAKNKANIFGIKKVFSDYEKLLNLDLDAVSICAPNFLHKEMAIKALASGKHVLCEKPLAINLKEAEEVVTAKEKYNKIFQIGFCHRFRGDSLLLKKMIEREDLGKIYHVIINLTYRRGIPSKGGWFTTKAKSGGGTLVDSAIHFLDLATWLCGSPMAVSVTGATYKAFGHKEDYIYLEMWGEIVPNGTFDVEDYACAFIRFDEGLSINLETAWACNMENTCEIKLLGDKTGVRIGLDEKLKILGQDCGALTSKEIEYRRQDRFLGQANHFLDSIEQNMDPEPSVYVGRDIQRIIEGIYLSSEIRKEIEITDKL